MPPLLLLDGWRIPSEELFKDWRTVVRLVLGLVVFTVSAWACSSIWLVLALPCPALPVAFAPAAVLSPADQIAVTAMATGPAWRLAMATMRAVRPSDNRGGKSYKDRRDQACVRCHTEVSGGRDDPRPVFRLPANQPAMLHPIADCTAASNVLNTIPATCSAENARTCGLKEAWVRRCCVCITVSDPLIASDDILDLALTLWDRPSCQTTCPKLATQALFSDQLTTLR